MKTSESSGSLSHKSSNFLSCLWRGGAKIAPILHVYYAARSNSNIFLLTKINKKPLAHGEDLKPPRCIHSFRVLQAQIFAKPYRPFSVSHRSPSRRPFFNAKIFSATRREGSQFFTPQPCAPKITSKFHENKCFHLSLKI
jgi:hypothetical protein